MLLSSTPAFVNHVICHPAHTSSRQSVCGHQLIQRHIRKQRSSWSMKSVPPTSTHSTTPTPLAVVTKLSNLNRRVQTIKCPFWRRRFSDSIDTMLQVMVWITKTRHKSLPLPLPSSSSTSSSPSVSSSSSASSSSASSSPRRRHIKTRNLDIQQRLQIIRDDFVSRQYYVTGRLTWGIYCDDCLFNSPDPDGRVKGLRKFCDATAGLFDSRLSRIDLIDIYVFNECEIRAEWRLEGALMLPWRPRIKPFVGSTTYRFNDEALVCSHVETWSISVIDAFMSVAVKGFGADPAPPLDVLLNQHEEKKMLSSSSSRPR